MNRNIQFCLFLGKSIQDCKLACWPAGLLGWICARSNETMRNKEYSHEGTTHQLKLSVRPSVRPFACVCLLVQYTACVPEGFASYRSHRSVTHTPTPASSSQSALQSPLCSTYMPHVLVCASRRHRIALRAGKTFNFCIKLTGSVSFSSQANYTDHVAAACQRS
jgi:hypothetical protein